MQKLNRGPESRECLQRALAVDANNVDVHYRLGEQLAAAGSLAEAEDQLRWCVERQPRNGSFTTSLATVVKRRVDSQSRAATVAPNRR
jgi:predicted Zn-dependent protease